MDIETKDFLKETFLFRDLECAEFEKAISLAKITARSFSRGETVYPTEDGEKKIGFLFDGRLEVRKMKDEGGFSVLNQLHPTESFGVLSVFSEDDFPTEIYATKSSVVLFISEDDVNLLLEKFPKISINLIKFMAERISFLNKKIKTFSGTRVEDRLLSYLLAKSEESAEKEFSLNFKKCSEAINAGRASVYRAINSLSEEGAIIISDKKIKVIKTERN